MEPGRTVRVRGLPTDIGDDRLKDKLFIHFLRSRNGGGEIDRVSLDKKEPGSALITFEDSLVARRITQLHWHHLDVDGRTFELSVSEHCERLDPDQVILNVSATVDFGQLPGGKAVLTSLHKRHPDVQTIFDPSTTTCIVCGAYSKVQMVLTHLLSCSQSLSHSSSSQPKQKAEFSKPQEHTFKEYREKRTREHNSRTSDERDKSTQSDLAAQKAAGGLSSLVEDYSLIVDSDMFQYLQKRCQDRYHQILSQYGVEVVDVSNQGLTTLFLHIADPDQGQEKERIQMAQDAISKLYQENEIKIRKDQLCKSILSPKGGLKRALKNISVKFPRILLNEDDVNVYIIGNRSDVCDAKQILLLDQGEDGAFFPDINTESVTPNVVDTDTLRLSTPTAMSLNDKKGPSGEDERRADTKYKLASRFKDSGLSTLSSLPAEFTFSGRQQPTSAPKGTKATPVNHTDDFRPAVKRTSSFSGSLQRKSHNKAPAFQDDSALPVAKSKVQLSSFSGQKDALTRGAYQEEIEAPAVLWEYIKEAYHSEVDDTTSDVQVKESTSQNGSDVNLSIKGASEPKVILCRSVLQTLIDNVRPDFSHLEIHLTELGISDPADETLHACCEEVRRRFAKVIVRTLKKSLLLLGPKKLCSQVGASLQEVFQGRCPKAGEDLPSSGFNGNRNGSPSNPHLRSPGASMQPHFGSELQFSVKKDPVKERVRSFGTSEQRIFIQPYPPTTEAANEFKGSELNRDGRSPKVEGSSPRAAEGGHNLQANPSNAFASSLAQGDQVLICVCGKTETPMTRTDCGTTMCSRCLETVHVYCRVCQATENTQQGIQGKMSHCKLNVSIPGSKDSAIKITYCIPNGIQGDSHPSPGRPFQGGVFEAFLPDCSKTRKLLPRLEEAFKLGFTFTVTSKDVGAKVTWASIPHKTSLQGGKSGKGYPDSSYLNRLSTVLTSLGIEE